MKLEERDAVARGILLDTYKEGFFETIFNTTDESKVGGWTLKSGRKSPVYFNLRPIASSPELVRKISHAMNLMIQEEVPGLDQLVGIEMAGVPLVAAIATAEGEDCRLMPYTFTRPIPGNRKPRTPEAAVEMVAELKKDPFVYGGKELVEGRFKDGQVLCITDDMVTNFGSKAIARTLIEYELGRRGVTGYDLSHVAVVLDREEGAAAQAQEYGMHLHALIPLKTKGLDWLSDVMVPEEHAMLVQYLDTGDFSADSIIAAREYRMDRGK